MAGARVDQARRADAAPATSAELARMLARPGLGFRLNPRQLGAELRAAILADHPAAGRPGRGRAALSSARAALDDACWTAARWLDDGRPFGAGDLGAAVGLSRPTIVGYLGVWRRAGLLERVDDQGRPVAPGTPTAPGTAALWRVTCPWTAERVEAMPDGWRPRLELAWRCLRAGASDEFVFGCLGRRPAANGDRTLSAWLQQAVRQQRRADRRQRRAVQRAAERADRGRECPAGEGLEGVARRLAEFGRRNLTPPVTERSSSGLKALELAPGSALAREARGDTPPRRTGPSAGLYRLVVESGRVRDDTEAERLWADVLRAAELVGEDDPVATFGQLARLAQRHARTLGDLVGRYERAAADARVAAVEAGAGVGRAVANAAALACYWLRKELVEGPPADSINTPQDVVQYDDDQVAEHVEGRPAALYETNYELEPDLEHEPERRLSAEERRAIRERVEVERQRQAATSSAPAEEATQSPTGRLAALLARARAEHRGRLR